jgi:hypothetical protein
MYKSQIQTKIYKIFLLSAMMFAVFLCTSHDFRHTLHQIPEFSKIHLYNQLDTDCCQNDSYISHDGDDTFYLVKSNVLENIAVMSLLFFTLLFVLRSFIFESKLRTYLKLYFLKSKLLRYLLFIYISFSRGILNPKLY